MTKRELYFKLIKELLEPYEPDYDDLSEDDYYLNTLRGYIAPKHNEFTIDQIQHLKDDDLVHLHAILFFGDGLLDMDDYKKLLVSAPMKEIKKSFAKDLGTIYSDYRSNIAYVHGHITHIDSLKHTYVDEYFNERFLKVGLNTWYIGLGQPSVSEKDFINYFIMGNLKRHFEEDLLKLTFDYIDDYQNLITPYLI